ncbi:hypothetical protein GOODEAATRI_013758, partial [Goodea atripinnis]
EQRPTRCKESHILEGLKRLQRRKHRSSSCSSKVSRSGNKDCMNSNEGIYSLGIKSSSKGVSKASHCGRTSAAHGKQFFYDSDDADDELAQSSCRDNIPTKDSWFHCKRLSHSISDSLCSWEGTQESGTGSAGSGLMVTNPCSGCDSKERPEKLVSFINNFLSDGEHKSAFHKPSKLHFSTPDPEGPKRLSDVNDHEELNSECSDVRVSCDQPTEQAEREFKRLSRDAAKLLKQKYLGKDQGRTQFIKTQTSSQSPKGVNTTFSNRVEWSKGLSSTSHHLPRRLLEYGKQEKDHINSVSKETVTLNASTQCDSLQAVYGIDLPPKMSSTEEKGEVYCSLQEDDVHAPVLPEEGDVCDKGKRSSQLFGRSISVTTKTHLKPALGMNGAKARSQSFSMNYIEKPNINVLEGPGKIRTQIITNSGERGNSLSRQSSLEVAIVGLAESPVHSPRTRLSHYGGMTGSTSTNGLPDKTSKSGSNGEGVTSPTHKEVRSLPTCERTSFNHMRKPKVAAHSQFQPQPPFYSSENPAREKEPVKTQLDSPIKPTVAEEKKISQTVCTIEEKVMMGIEENLQKSQEQEKVAASEAKQKTGPSLANWFGLRKSKLPALSGKKSESPKGKEEKKDLKIGSVLGGKQTKPEKKKDKKKENQDVQNLSEMNNKLSSIMDHCNNQMGQIASQIQCTTAFIGKDQFVKDLLGRWVFVTCTDK